MLTLQIEHEVPNYEGWQKAFESDPIDRKGSGVRRYRIYKTVDVPGTVIVELDFDDKHKLQSTLQALQNMWNKVQGTIIMSPKTRIIELVREQDL